MTVCDDCLKICVGKLPAETNHALMGCRTGMTVEGFAPADFHFDSPSRCRFQNLRYIPAPLALGEDNFTDVDSLTPESLQDGIDAVDDSHKMGP